METKKVNGKFEFDYKLTGLIFIDPLKAVLMLNRDTGQQVTVNWSELVEKLSAKLIKSIESDLMLMNIWTSPQYQLIGLRSEVDSDGN